MYELFVRNINIIRQHFLSVSTDYLANSLDLGVLLVYLWVVCWDFPEFVRAGNFVLITLIITLRKKQNIQKHKKPTKPTLGWIFVCSQPRNGLLNFFSSDKILSIPTSRVVLLMCLHSLLRYRVFSHSYSGWKFFLQPIAAECWRGRGGKMSRILGKPII